MWSNKAWVGRFFTRGAKPPEFLAQYSAVFNSVEGNTTFYATPPSATLIKWRAAAAAAADFRFLFKFPRRISHECGLQQATAETLRFL